MEAGHAAHRIGAVHEKAALVVKVRWHGPLSSAERRVAVALYSVAAAGWAVVVALKLWEDWYHVR